ncbi:tRNA uridine 5-carboxymethylaminomethyl modification enzyme [Natranaerovirga pectinivora]|uniref:tRNA uridine 5-carboxymethylaminomethyl modification enzyme MnmG n=1 Tax=Natranaerovirga pectinivora TaxID=682400 RepID=A0A4R3MEZ5_9FIRM|nr:tRNA uridine-5-carboxymethylaminomethyl(34) synthesis enzyme MnmG [Natranaerovirga pectinivora]TCT12247.1 tRNA uridine 5-carboxymethylaminomethyl modification enzyme [Natranaerovirga pectinivora]
MTYEAGSYDIIVVGGGHAGCEAALAAARLGLKTIVFAMNIDTIAMMACNPSIGGTSKGHLVREIDALGGQMGKVIDKSFIQSRMLNTGKGPAVHSLRAQADKYKYSKEMKKVIENQENLTLRQNEIVEILVEDNKVVGVKTVSNAIYNCKAVVLATGTYLKSKCIYGDVSIYSGPSGLQTSNVLSENLKTLGIEILRFKTGTPARIDKRTVDFSKMIEQQGDDRIIPFSFDNNSEDIKRVQIPCWLTYTNKNTHEVINNNLDRSPLYSGVIEGTGPRYCPSIEDKIVRFADKDRHQVFLEPEGEDTNEMYVGGMSSSLPEDVQIQMYRTVDGMENVEIMRNAYAIEYDCINPLNLKSTLELKNIDGLFSGGQFNGSSGYEEAAAQGLIAGINASLKVLNKEQLILDRSEAYIGVLIDDLVTKGTKEPYRMMTSRAEYRLLLRQDNADLRLTKIGYNIGLITEEKYNRLLEKEKNITSEIYRLEKTIIGATKEVQKLLEEHNSTLLKSGTTLAELIKRPELSYEILKPIDSNRPDLTSDVIEQINIQIKYEGYIKRQLKQVEQFKKLENKKLPEDMDYTSIKGLRTEAKQKLSQVKPLSIGQASRISGVSPADISVLLVFLEQIRRSNKERVNDNE